MNIPFQANLIETLIKGLSVSFDCKVAGDEPVSKPNKVVTENLIFTIINNSKLTQEHKNNKYEHKKQHVQLGEINSLLEKPSLLGYCIEKVN